MRQCKKSFIGCIRKVDLSELKSTSSIANVAQSVERIHGKDEVSGSIPDIGSVTKIPDIRQVFLFFESQF